jgi:hypothetical protein
MFVKSDRLLGRAQVMVSAHVSGGVPWPRQVRVFATLVGDFRTATIVMNTLVGRVALEMFRLRLLEYPDRLMGLQVVERECR